MVKVTLGLLEDVAVEVEKVDWVPSTDTFNSVCHLGPPGHVADSNYDFLLEPFVISSPPSGLILDCFRKGLELAGLPVPSLDEFESGLRGESIVDVQDMLCHLSTMGAVEIYYLFLSADQLDCVSVGTGPAVYLYESADYVFSVLCPAEEWITQPLDCILPARPTFITLISYLTANHKFTSAGAALVCFEVAHYEFVTMLTELDDNGKVMSQICFKAYYKFRHNIFSFVCTRGIVDSEDISTDSSLSQYIESKKTPDLIIESDTKIILLEFAVSNRYETLDYYKGSGADEIKYFSEAEAVTAATGKYCTVIIVGAVLDENNVDELLAILEPLDSACNADQLLHFFNICNTSRHVINNSMQKSLQNEDIEPIYPLENSYESPKAGTVIMLTPDFLRAVSRSADRFRSSSSRILDSSRGLEVVLSFEMSTNRITLDYSQPKKWSMPISKFVLGLEQHPVDLILSMVRVYNEGRKMSIKDMRGNIPYTLRLPSLHVANFIKSPPRPLMEVYRGTVLPLEYHEVSLSGYREMGQKYRVLFPPDYFHQLSTCSFDKVLLSNSKKQLANCFVNPESIKECVDIFDSHYKEAQIKLDIRSPKPTFMFPLLNNFTKSSHPVKNTVLAILVKHTRGYTQETFKRALNGRVTPLVDMQALSESIKGARQHLSEANSVYVSKIRQLGLVKRYNTYTANEKMMVLTEKRSLVAAQQEYSKRLSAAKGVRNENLVKMPRGKQSPLARSFKTEMSHYNRATGQYRGLGEMSEEDYEGFDHFLKSLICRLKEIVPGPDLPPLYSNSSEGGPELLGKLKSMHVDEFNTFSDSYFASTYLDRLSLLYADISKHLFLESTKPYNSGYVKVENLGYDGLVVMVKGGSKIYKNQTSKLFRIGMLVEQQDLKWMGYLENDNFQIVSSGGACVVLTPWQQLHQDVLFDYMSLRQRTFMNLFSSYTRVARGADGVPDLLYLPFVLALHNRRKTEEFMHNSRYIIVNALADHANIQGIITSFAGFNYTYLDGWLRLRISKSYSIFAENLNAAKRYKGHRVDDVLKTGGLRDLWLNQPLLNADQLTTFIYITYMMSKAPVNSSVEQATNLWSILEDVNEYQMAHSLVQGLDDESQRFDLLVDGPEVFEDDFKYDPKFCNYLGYHISSHLKTQFTLAEISNEWEKLRKTDLHEIANSNGLRGWKTENFYNKKGYEVVYEKISELVDSEELNDCISKYLDVETHQSKILIDQDKIYLDDSPAGKQLLFHIVHKIQRGGGREIFCMDMETKYLQRPIEKMFQFLCKRIPNEFISVPSSKRHGLIHTDFFEKGPNSEAKHVLRWVLDCRRWAPHSVFQKYVHFVEGMALVLPPEFVKHFRLFSKGMFEKKFLIRDHVYKKIVNNVKFGKYQNYVKASQIANTFEITVKFSFVMGIFNYLSTMMHAANQIVASEIVRNQCLNRGLGLVILDPKCHSDDSVVSSYHEDPRSYRASICLYEWLLKGANHMLSIKKCQVNRGVYLEFLSVLYLFDRYLPVLPKFTSSLPFKPSDKGYGADASFAITQAIEMISQGATYEEAYLSMKLTERYVQSCYRLNPVKGMPPQMLGELDSHPIELIYSGGLADAYRAMRFNPDQFWRSYNLLQSFELLNPESADLSLNWDMSSRVSGDQRRLIGKYSKVFEALPKECEWTITNSKLGNSKLNLLWYVNKLLDRSFFSSLVNEPAARKFARMFGSAAYRNLKSHNGKLYSVSRLTVALGVLDEPSDISCEPDTTFEQFMNFCCRDLGFFYDAIEGATIKEVQPANVPEKPMVFSQSAGLLGKVRVSATEYVSFTREPKGFKLLGKRKNPKRDCNKITTQLKLLGVDIEGLSNDQLAAIVSKLLRDDARNYRFVMCVPGDSRKVNSYQDALKTLSYNSSKWKRYRLVSLKAASVDWSMKIMSGSIPIAVKEYLECYWMIQVAEKNGVVDEDIFKLNLQELCNSKREETPRDWKPILAAECSPSNCLADMPYWCCWTQEQARLGPKWYGAGECYLSLPELEYIRFKVTSGRVNLIGMKGFSTGQFSVASSWYLGVFLNNSEFFHDYAPSEFGDPNSVYLGYHSSTGLYGVGRPSSFDFIYMNSTPDEDATPAFIYKEMATTPIRNGAIYHGDLDYKVHFFIPIEQPLVIDLKKYLDADKLKKQLNMPNIRSFVRNVATGVMSAPRRDLDFMIRNITHTLLYNVVHQSPDLQSVESGLQVKNAWFRALSNWKTTHPGLGFPNKDELSSLVRRGESAPLSPAVVEYVGTLASSSLNQAEFEVLMFRLLSMHEEDRLSYLTSLFPDLTSEHQAQSLVLIRRSRRIYSSCQYLPKGQFSLFCELVALVKEVLVTGNIRPPSLTQQVLLKGEGPILQRLVGAWQEMACRVIYSAAPARGTLSQSVQACQEFYRNFKEILESGGKQLLNLCSQNSTILRTVEFGVEDEVICTWLIHVMDAMCYHEKLSIGTIPTFQNLAGEKRGKVNEGAIVSELHGLRGYMVKNQPVVPLSITIVQKKRVKRGNRKANVEVSQMLDLCKNPVLGITHEPFKPLDEDGEDEFMYGWEYEDDFEDLTYDEDADIPKLAYCFLHILDKYTLRKVRGTAWDVIVAFRVLGTDIQEVADKITYYQDKKDDTLFFAWTGKAGLIENTKKLAWEDIGTITGKGGFKSPALDIDGVVVPKEEAWASPKHRNSLSGLDSYFLQMRAGTQEKEIEKIEQVIKVVQTGYELDPEYSSNKRDLDKLLIKEGLKKEEKELLPVDEGGLTEVLSKMGDLLDNLSKELTGGGGEAGLLKMFDPKLQYQFKEPISLLSDEHLLGELEALLPGYWGMIMNKEIALTKNQKADRLDLAAVKISRMTGTDKETYTALYRVIRFLFTLLPERGGVAHLSNAFMIQIDSLFNRGERSENSEGLYPLHLLSPGEPFDMPDDLSFLE
jgi:hypothetical protein